MRKALDALAVLALAALAAIALVHAGQQHLLFGDFRAFYCGGFVLLHGGDPYAQLPLYACESAHAPFSLYAATHGIAVPAPFPGYALAAFALLALLPLPAAAMLWLVGSIAAIAIAARSASRTFGYRWSAALALFGVPVAVGILPYGELAPFVVCAAMLAAVWIREGQYGRAAAAIAVLALLPNVAAPAFLALLLFVKPMRVPLAVVCAALFALDLLAGGPALALRYVTQILPAHAISEIGATSQYGTTWIAHSLGLSDALAVHVPEALYALVVVALLALFARSRDDRKGAETYVLVALTWALLAGPFVHFAEIVLALPLACALYAATRERGMALAGLVVATPWLWLVQEPTLCVVFAAFAFVTLRFLFGRSAAFALRATLGIALASGVFLIVAHFAGAQLGTSAAHVDPALAQASWAGYIRSGRASSGPVWWLLKAPTWLALAALALRGAFFVAQEHDVTTVAVSATPAAL